MQGKYAAAAGSINRVLEQWAGYNNNESIASRYVREQVRSFDHRV